MLELTASFDVWLIDPLRKIELLCASVDGIRLWISSISIHFLILPKCNYKSLIITETMRNSVFLQFLW